MNNLIHYDWPGYRLLVSFNVYGNSTNYGVLLEHATFENFYEWVKGCFDGRVPVGISVVMLSDELFDQYADDGLQIVEGG